MLEIMLSTPPRPGGGTYPNSGPGPKTLLFGDTTNGFFGEVSSTELMSIQQVWALAKMTVGTMYTFDLVWLKFFYDEKVLFIPKNKIGANMSWEDIYKGGSVYGVRGNGPFPVSGAATDQYCFTIVNEAQKKWPMVLRLIRGMDTDPNTLVSTHTNSEWTRLMYKVQTGMPAPLWANYSISDMGGDVMSICMETWNNSQSYIYARGNTSGVAAVTNIPKTQGNYWRPCFELLDINKIAIDPADVTYGSDELSPPNIIEVAEDQSTWLKNPTDLVYTDSPGLLGFSATIQTANTLPDIDVIDWGVPQLKDFGFTVETV